MNRPNHRFTLAQLGNREHTLPRETGKYPPVIMTEFGFVHK